MTEKLIEAVAQRMRRERFARARRTGCYDSDLPLTPNALEDARAALSTPELVRVIEAAKMSLNAGDRERHIADDELMNALEAIDPDWTVT